MTTTRTNPSAVTASKAGLEVVAMHRLIVAAGGNSVDYIGAAAVKLMGSRAHEFVGQYLVGMRERSEGQGRAQSAWWLATIPPFLSDLMTCPAKDFDAASRTAVEELARQAPGNARSGLVVFLRDVGDDGESVKLLCLKMALSQLSLARFHEKVRAADAITVDDIGNILPKAIDLRKGALIPHPDGGADLRVVDDELNDPADYWLRFLQARARPKEPQVAKMAVTVATRALENVPGAQALVAAELDRVKAGEQPISAKSFLRHIEEAAGLDRDELWRQAAQAEPVLAREGAVISPRAAELVETVIDLGQGVRVVGPSSEVDRRFTITPSADGGWTTTITSEQKPDVRHQRRPG